LVANLKKGARVGVHGGGPQLLGVHLAEALVARERDAAPAALVDELGQLLGVSDGDWLTAPGFDRVRRGANGSDVFFDGEQLLVLGRVDEVPIDDAHAGARAR